FRRLPLSRDRAIALAAALSLRGLFAIASPYTIVWAGPGPRAACASLRQIAGKTNQPTSGLAQYRKSITDAKKRGLTPASGARPMDVYPQTPKITTSALE